MATSTLHTAPERGAQRRGDRTRQALLDAALVEFAASGFEAASTRDIARRAGVRQGQLTYHFASKHVLWQATVDRLFERFDELLAAGAPAIDPADQGDARSRLARSIRALVRAVAALPELNRIMVHEATARTPRLEWIVEQHVRDRFDSLADQWLAVRADGQASDADPIVIYYTVVGVASLLYVNTPEAHLLLGRDDLVDDTVIDAHADLLVTMLLGNEPSTASPATTEGT